MKYVTIPGQSYSGSTLLAFLLETNPAFCSNGSICGPMSVPDTSTYLCSCRDRLVDCTFWNTVQERMVNAGHPFDLSESTWPTAFQFSDIRLLNIIAIRSLRSNPLNQLRNSLLWKRGSIARSLSRQAHASTDLARIVCELRGSEIFVDSTRDPLRPIYLTRFAHEEPWVIHLVRDPRANVASIMRHKPSVHVSEAARQWWRANTEALRNRTEVSSNRWIPLRYEDLCSDPQKIMNQVADHLGVTHAPLPSDFKAMEHHILGNEMRLENTGAVTLDTTWIGKFDRNALSIIERQCRPLAEELGYDWNAPIGQASSQ